MVGGRQFSRCRAWGIAAVALAVAGQGGCYRGGEGDPNADGDGGDGPPAGLCADPDPDVSFTPLRRLTRAQYDNAIRDLLGLELGLSASLTADEKVGPFDANAVAPVAEVMVEEYQSAAQEVAAVAVADLDTLVPCDPQADGVKACALTFIEQFGARAYRRPLTDDESARALALFESGWDETDFAAGIELVIRGFLQSPHFLYHVEGGVDGDPVQPLSGHALAARLSFFVWNSIPDAGLLAAADAGTLGDPAVIEAEVRRMLEDPRATAALVSFHRQWLRLEGLDSLDKDPAVFPDFDPQLRASMAAETELFVDHVIRQGDGRLQTLLQAPFSIVDARLAAHYGIAGPTEPAEFWVVDLDPAQRSGLLTQAGFLAINAHAEQTSPVDRGKFVRENVLCQPMAPPPPDVDDAPPQVDPNLPTKDRFEQHRADPSCAACHALMDPLGFGFEHYDATGRWRTMDGNAPVDATGEIIGTEAIDGPFDGAIQLMDTLASSDQVRACVADQWFRFAFGRFESDADACSRTTIYQRFADSDFDVRELMVGVAVSDAMRFRRTEPDQ